LANHKIAKKNTTGLIVFNLLKNRFKIGTRYITI